jgi:NADH-quinone oxidoreductase subunit E
MAVRRLAAPALQPKSFAFSADNLVWAEKEVTKYPQGRHASAVIALLWRAQAQSGGWLPEAAIRYVADFLGMAHIRVLEIATFYTMFNLEPVGRFYVQVCGTTPCMLRGAEDLKALCRKRIGEVGQVSADGLFSWTEVECLGACVNAPMLQINEDNYEDLDPEILSRIFDDLAAGRSPKPGPQIDRQYSAPLGGPTTLTTVGRATSAGKMGATEDSKTLPPNGRSPHPSRSEV